VREIAEVSLVEVAVRVTGRDGQPVRNLQAADFTLLDDGRKQTIVGFDAIDLAEKTPAGQMPPQPPGARAPAKATSSPIKRRAAARSSPPPKLKPSRSSSTCARFAATGRCAACSPASAKAVRSRRPCAEAGLTPGELYAGWRRWAGV
jgi:hypothetical protein